MQLTCDAQRPQLLLWNQRQRRRQGHCFPVFVFAKTTAVMVWHHTLFWSYNSRRLFQASAPLKQKYVLGAIEYSLPTPEKSKCEAEKFKDQWIDGQIYHKKNNFCTCCLQMSCSKAGRQHLWRFVSVDKFLCALRQVGHTWRGQLVTGIWRIFLLSKQTCLSFAQVWPRPLVGWPNGEKLA